MSTAEELRKRLDRAFRTPVPKGAFMTNRVAKDAIAALEAAEAESARLRKALDLGDRLDTQEQVQVYHDLARDLVGDGLIPDDRYLLSAVLKQVAKALSSPQHRERRRRCRQ